MAAIAYVAVQGVAAGNPGLGAGPAGLAVSWIILADDGSVTAGPAGPFVIANFSHGDAWASIQAGVTEALQANYGDPALQVVFLGPGA
jgi:hypothetical protein